MGCQYIQFTATVNPVTVGKFVRTVQEKENNESLTVLLSTPIGGDKGSAWVLHDFVRSLSAEGVSVTMYNIDKVNSVGEIVFRAADNRFAAPGASFEVNTVTEFVYVTQPATNYVWGNDQMSTETTVSASEAVELGIAHDVRIPRIPDGVVVEKIIDWSSLKLS